MGIDFDHLKRYTGEDADLIAEVLDIFTSQTERWMRALDPASDDESWTGVAHALKGSAQTVGAVTLGALCERAEAMVGADVAGRRDYIAGEIANAVAELNLVVQRWHYDRQMAMLRG